MFASLRLPLITLLRWAIPAVSGNDSSPTGVIFICQTPINLTLLQDEREENLRNDLWHTQKKKKKRKKESSLSATLQQRLINSLVATTFIYCNVRHKTLQPSGIRTICPLFPPTSQSLTSRSPGCIVSGISKLTDSTTICCALMRVFRNAGENNWGRDRKVEVIITHNETTKDVLVSSGPMMNPQWQ